MADLSTTYMGLKIRNPLILASCDLSKSAARIKDAEQSGLGAVVLKSIFEEQFIMEAGAGNEAFGIYPEALDYLRSGGLVAYAPDNLCRMIEEAKKSVSIPIIASINCQTPKLWPDFAHQLQEAGADALELNIYVLPIEVDRSGADYEEAHERILKEVKRVVRIPVAVKLTPQVSSLPHLARRLCHSGCDGLVFFNWFIVPDIDIRTLKTRTLKGEGNFHQTLRWIGLLSGRIDCDIAASGGVRGAEDAIKLLLAGASAVQVCTLFMQKGVKEAGKLVDRIEAWMKEHSFASVPDFQGELSFKKQELSRNDLGYAQAYFRTQYLKLYS